MKLKLKNHTNQPQGLEDGTVLAAAGTPGSIKEVEKLTDADRVRLVERERVSIVDKVSESDQRYFVALKTEEELPPPKKGKGEGE